MTNKKLNKLDKTIFEAYTIAINNKMKAGHDVGIMPARLNCLLSKYKHK